MYDYYLKFFMTNIDMGFYIKLEEVLNITQLLISMMEIDNIDLILSKNDKLLTC